ATPAAAALSPAIVGWLRHRGRRSPTGTMLASGGAAARAASTRARTASGTGRPQPGPPIAAQCTRRQVRLGRTRLARLDQALVEVGDGVDAEMRVAAG